VSRYGRKYAAAFIGKGRPDPASFDINAAVRREEARAQKDWMTFDPKGYVYLLGNKKLEYYKIGLTRSLETPDFRFQTIQQGVPFELDVLHYWFASHAQSFEKLVHHEYKAKKIRGEWFRFTADELPEVVAKIKSLADKVIPPGDAPERDPESDPD
jgi:hypothetical protein